MGMLINLIIRILSQHICMSNNHFIYFRYTMVLSGMPQEREKKSTKWTKLLKFTIT